MILKRPRFANLPKYKETALYFFDKSLTAKEMNTFVAELQNRLHYTNNSIDNSLREIKGIYKALDTLDKDYIEGIIESLNKANEAINDVKKNSEQNAETIGALNMTVEELLKLKGTITQLKIAYGITTAVLIAGLIASFLI